jgi:heptosyltransferase-2
MKILITRFSSIGDIVLTFPILRCLKIQSPSSEIHYATKSQFKELLTASEYIDRQYFLENSLKDLIKALRKEKYDLIIDLHNNLRTLQISTALGLKTLRFPKLNFKKWLLVNLKVNKMPNLHLVDRYFHAVKTLGVVNDGKNNTFFISPENEIDIKKQFNLSPKSYISVVIGAQFSTKRIPLDKLIKILSGINYPMVLIGGKTDKIVATELCKNLTKKEIYSACGDFNILQSASIVKQSKAVLTNDTGMMHIASCFSLPITTVWGNTSSAFGMSAYTPENNSEIFNFEVQDLACRPCSKIGFQKCPKGHFKCMELQDALLISQQINKGI